MNKETMKNKTCKKCNSKEIERLRIEENETAEFLKELQVCMKTSLFSKKQAI